MDSKVALAQLLCQQGNFDAGIPIMETVLSQTKEDDLVNRIRRKRELSGVCSKAGRHEEATRYIEEVVNFHMQAYGIYSPHTVIVYNEYFNIYTAAKRFDELIGFMQRLKTELSSKFDGKLEKASNASRIYAFADDWIARALVIARRLDEALVQLDENRQKFKTLFDQQDNTLPKTLDILVLVGWETQRMESCCLLQKTCSRYIKKNMVICIPRQLVGSES